MPALDRSKENKMNKRLEDVLNGREDNYLLPFYWQHGDHHDKIPEQIERIRKSGCRAFCVESRPHKDFCGEGWWRDMDLIISEAKKRDMKVWIFDDDHYPTGHANGQIKNHPELRQLFLTERHVDVLGPVKNSLIRLETQPGDKLIGVYAFKRTGVDEASSGEPIDLSACVGEKYLRFDLPDGCWRVFFYYETHRGFVRPDYIDMINEESVKVLIDTVYESHFAHYGDEFGKTIAGFFSDEPCFGNGWIGAHSIDLGFYNHRIGMPGLALPWRSDIPDLMEAEVGKKVLPLLGGFWFDIGEVTPVLRHAYMDTVTKLYRDCFTRQLGGWCEAHGVQYIGHIIEDMNAHGRLSASGGHYFRSLDGQHMSGIDIVLHQIIPGMADYVHTGWAFGNNADPKFYDIILAKLGASFAHIGTQTEGRAMCEVFGAYGWAEGTPMMKWLIDFLLVRGINRFIPHAFSPEFPDPDCPPHFGADDKDPQFEGFTALMNYTNKAAHLLDGRTHKADAAVLYHADAEWMNDEGSAMMTQVPAKALYDAHIDFDILPADCFTENSGSNVFKAFAKDGRLAVGRETYQILAVPYAEVLPRELEDALAKLEVHGVKIVRTGKDFDEKAFMAEVDASVSRDIVIEGGHPQLRAIHFYDDTSDIYMFSNESVTETAVTSARLASVKDAGECLLLDLLNGESAMCKVSAGILPLELPPYSSVIAVFDREGLPAGIPPLKKYIELGDADLSFDVETAFYTDMKTFVKKAEKVSVKDLPAFSASEDMTEFSGKIRYTGRFNYKQDSGLKGIDLGEVGMTAHVWLNGNDLGLRICPPYRYDIEKYLKEGENEIVIEVSNTLANAVYDRFTAFLSIPASGLIGPIMWLK